MPSHRFVWTSFNVKLFPEKWPRDMMMDAKPVASHDITDEEMVLSIHRLVERYPAPRVMTGDELLAGLHGISLHRRSLENR